MRMRKIFIAIALVLLLLAMAVVWLLANLNRFRPLVEERFAEQTGTAIDIRGDLGWALAPAPALIGADIQSSDGNWRIAEVRFHPLSNSFSLRGLKAQTAELAGLCDLEFSLSEALAGQAPAPDPGQIIPVALLSNLRGEGDCAGLRFAKAAPALGQFSADFTAQHGQIRLELRTPDVLGGEGLAQLSLNVLAEPVAWQLDFNLEGLEGAALRPWLGPQTSWQAQAELFGAFQSAGNTPAELASSISGEARLQAGKGQLRAPILQEILTAAARLSRTSPRLPSAPLQHQSLTGVWTVQGADQKLRVQMDNLVVETEGQHHFLTGQLDLAGTVTFIEDPNLPQLAPNPILVGLPIPVRCTGVLAQPDCALDAAAAGRLIDEMLRGEADAAQQEKLNAVIDGLVPPEHQKAARALLQALRRSRDEDRP